jgi:3-hydroxybutyrate dehydrogenase
VGEKGAGAEMNILITGAGSGLGRGLALHFAEAGHQIFAADVNEDSARETAALAGASPSRIRGLKLDVTSDGEIAALASSLDGAAVEVLINNAGLQQVSRLESFSPATWSHMVDVMLTGASRTAAAVLPSMKERNFGRIVNIGSVLSLVGASYKTAYAAAKHGLLGFSKSLALETAEHDITVNTICPAFIMTPLMQGQIKDQAREHGIPEQDVIEEIMLKPMPKKAFITVEEIAGTIGFLLGPDARNITGQAIALDGGWTCQ